MVWICSAPATHFAYVAYPKADMDPMALSIPDHHCPVTLAVMAHRARHGFASG